MLTEMNTKHTGRYKHISIHTQHAMLTEMSTKHTGRFKHRSIHTQHAMLIDMNTKHTGRYKHTKHTKPKIGDITRYKEYSMHVSPNVINETTKKQCVHTV